MKKEGVIINQKEHTDIFNWLSKNVLYYEESQNQYTLTSEGKINAYCSVYLKEPITQIKYPFGYVRNNFNCVGCYNLTSLIGSPDKVEGNLYFSCCKKITSLVGASKDVGKHFACSRCINLTSLVGAPEKVNGYFDCSLCENLTSLVGAPEKVDGYFNCSRCENLTSLVGLPKYVKNNIDFGHTDFPIFHNNQFSNDPKNKETYKLYLAMWLELLESVSNEERKEYITNYKDKVDKDFGNPIIPIEILKEYGF